MQDEMLVTKGPSFAMCFVFVLGIGCSGTRQHETASPVTIATTSPNTAPSSATPGAGDTALQETNHASSQSNRCAPEGSFPPLTFDPSPAALLPCRPAEVAAEKKITADMKTRYQRQMDRSRVEVTFGCDGLDRVISRIVLESGSGHGGSFEIIELSRPDPNAITYDVMGVRLSSSMLVRPKSPFQITRTTVSQEAIFARMPLIRTALRTKIDEIEIPPPPGSMTGGGSGFGSSSNFHVHVRLEDASARVLEGHYTGYESSDAQAQYLPLERAREELEPALVGLTWNMDAPPDEIKRLFERRFADARNRFSDAYAWWVRERYVKLAAYVGTRALIPSLLPLLAPATKDASTTRTRDYAFETLVALTGWDPRAPEENEPPRTIEAAAHDFITECGRVPLMR